MENIKNFRKNFIWNIMGTTFNAFNSLFFLITVTRINGLTDAGIFTLAFSTACILFIIGVYVGRVYQVTEINKNITDKEYIVNRIISCTLMLILTICFVIVKQYNLYKASIFILLAIYKCLEAFSDVFYGIMQKNDMLYIVGKSYFIKALYSLIAFIIVDVTTHNLILSCLSIILLWIFFLIFYDIKKTKSIIDFSKKVDISRVIEIFKKGFLMFAISFLGLYILNAPKYAIDTFLTEDIQAIFGIIIMPATVMSLVNQFLIHPYLNNMAKLYNENNISQLKKLTNKIVLIVFIAGILASIIAYFLGIPVLNMIYGINLNGYQVHLLIIIIASTLYNIGIIYASVLTTIRSMFSQFLIYSIVVVITSILSNILTKSNAINGATMAYCITMLLFFLLYIIVTHIKLQNKNSKIYNYN